MPKEKQDKFLVHCRKCKWWFYSKDPDAHYHKKCQPIKTIRINQPKFKKYRDTILIRDNYTCQLCGKKKLEGHNLHVHHIDGDYEYNKINNLVVLCCRCHRKVHKNLAKYKKLSDFPLKPKKDFEYIPPPEPRKYSSGKYFKNIPDK